MEKDVPFYDDMAGEYSHDENYDYEPPSDIPIYSDFGEYEDED